MKMNLVFFMGLIAAQAFTGSSHASVKMKRAESPASTMNLVKEPVYSSEFATIRAGKFIMGSPFSEEGRDEDELVHYVTFSKDFEIQTTEITQAQWFSVMGYNPSYNAWKDYCPDDYREINGTRLCPRLPVDSVSWDDTQAFIQKLNQIQDDYVYRLPTEAEWEYAARGGSQTAYPFGDDPATLRDYAWSENTLGQTWIVGSMKPNQYGLYDMHGNVAEWVQDWYAECYPPDSQLDPEGPVAGSLRVIRGAGIFSYGYNYRSASRYYDSPEGHFYDRGFRLVRTAK